MHSSQTQKHSHITHMHTYTTHIPLFILFFHKYFWPNWKQPMLFILRSVSHFPWIPQELTPDISEFSVENKWSVSCPALTSSPYSSFHTSTWLRSHLASQLVFSDDQNRRHVKTYATQLSRYDTTVFQKEQISLGSSLSTPHHPVSKNIGIFFCEPQMARHIESFRKVYILHMQNNWFYRRKISVTSLFLLISFSLGEQIKLKPHIYTHNVDFMGSVKFTEALFDMTETYLHLPYLINPFVLNRWHFILIHYVP